MRIHFSINRLLVLLLAAACGIQAGAVEADVQPLMYYVQLIRGTDQERGQEAAWKPIGPKLTSRLSPVFRWKHYWEVHRQAIPVQQKKVRRYHLSDVREVEIELLSPAEIEIRLYLKGKLMEKSRQLTQTHMGIIGGDRIGDESWFVVVRRDKPH